MYPFSRFVLLLAACALLAACGNRGPLTLSPTPQTAKTAPAEKKAAPDHNSPAVIPKQ